MKDFDPFARQKEASFTVALQQIMSQGNKLCNMISKPNLPQSSAHDLRMDFELLILVRLVVFEIVNIIMKCIILSDVRYVYSMVKNNNSLGIIRNCVFSTLCSA